MRIVESETFAVGTPPPHKGGRYFLFVKLVADNGLVGWGEMYGATFGPHTMCSMADDVIERDVVGCDPSRRQQLWRRLYSRGFTQRPDVSLGAIMSAVDIACWDLVGQHAGLSIAQMGGGVVHDRLRTYTYLYPADDEVDIHSFTDVYGDPVAAAARARDYVDQGFDALKLDPMGGYGSFDPRQPSMVALDVAESFLLALRDEVGSSADLLFGTHGQFSPSGARRLAARIEPYEPLWFEEPVPPDSPAAMAEVAAGTSIPVAAGERLTTKYEFAALMAAGAVGIVQPNVARCGGLTEGHKIAALAEANHVQVAPHCYNGPIGAAANIGLAATLPNFLILEAIEQFGGFHAELLTNPIQWENGDVVPFATPGLGTAINEEVARAHPYEGPDLHLEMKPDPIRF